MNEDQLGTWVRNSYLDPQTNIAGIKWKTSDGEFSGTYHGVNSIPPQAYLSPEILWFFPDDVAK